MRFIYTLLIHLVAPCVFLVQLYRGIWNHAYWDRLGERFGFTRLVARPDPIWIHAVSVGEVQAIVPLVQQLLTADATAVVITTGTVTGAARVRALFADRVQHCYLPYDLPYAMRRFLSRIRPRAGIILETELWPNLLHVCHMRNMPLVLANARISPRTEKRYRYLANLFRRSLATVYVGAQTAADAARLGAMGVVAARTVVTGNIKFDLTVTATVQAAGQCWRQANAATRPVWIAGSTHAGEEEQVLAAHQHILRTLPQALLILVPRHPPRFTAVHALLTTQSFVCVTRTSGHTVDAATQVLLLDTLGELNAFYAASDVAFVGGSLVPIGGHNLLEPAAFGLPIVTGPSQFNAADIATQFFTANAALKVHSAAELATTVLTLLQDSKRAHAQGQQAQQLLQMNRGATERTVQLLARACLSA